MPGIGEENDFVIVDTAAGGRLPPANMAVVYDCHLAVTVATRPAIEAARETIGLARDQDVPRQMVAVNKVRHGGEIVRVMGELNVCMGDIFPVAYDEDAAMAGRGPVPVTCFEPGPRFVGDVRQIVDDLTLDER